MNNKSLYSVIVCMIFSSFFYANNEPLYTIETLFEKAKETPTLAISAIEHAQAHQNVREASAARLPKIDLGVYGQYEQNPLTVEDLIPGVMGTLNNSIDTLNTSGKSQLDSINSSIDDLNDFFADLSNNLPAGVTSPVPSISPIDNWTSIPNVAFEDPYKVKALFSAELTQPIFTWGKISSAIKMARLGVEAASIKEIENEREFFTKMGVLLAQIHYLQNIVEIAEKQLETTNRLLIIANENVENNVILPVEAQLVKVQALELEANIEKLAATRDSALYAVAEYTQISDLQIEQIDFSFIPQDISALPRFNKEQAFYYAQNDGSILLNLQTAINNEQKNLIASDAWAKPDVGFKLGTTVHTKTYESSQDVLNWNLTAVIAINARIFDGGETRSKLKKAELQTAKSMQEQEKIQIEMKQKINEIFSSLAYKEKFELLYREKIDYLEQNLEIKNNELLSGYIEEREYLKSTIEYYATQIQQQQNALSLFSDYCLYRYLSGEFPQDFLISL